MKKVLILLLLSTAGLTSCTAIPPKENDSQPSSFQPDALNDPWFNWLVGLWECRLESGEGEAADAGHATGEFKFEYDLNGQFLIMRGLAQTTELTSEQIQYLKDTLKASDKDIEKMQRNPFKELQIHTIDPKTGQRIGYLFDSMRCVATGTARLEGNKEIMEWVWSAQGQGGTSVSIIEKIDDNNFSLYHKYTLPNGKIMEDKGIMTRKIKEIPEMNSNLKSDMAKDLK